jgi:predicted nucleic acid-binding protein
LRLRDPDCLTTPPFWPPKNRIEDPAGFSASAVARYRCDFVGLPGDPADRFIAATAIAPDATLVTADTALLKWRHKLRGQNAAQ